MGGLVRQEHSLTIVTLRRGTQSEIVDETFSIPHNATSRRSTAHLVSGMDIMKIHELRASTEISILAYLDTPGFMAQATNLSQLTFVVNLRAVMTAILGPMAYNGPYWKPPMVGRTLEFSNPHTD